VEFVLVSYRKFVQVFARRLYAFEVRVDYVEEIYVRALQVCFTSLVLLKVFATYSSIRNLSSDKCVGPHQCKRTFHVEDRLD
jgi:hypothetical protein